MTTEMEFLTGMNIVLTLMNVGMIVYINTNNVFTKQSKGTYDGNEEGSLTQEDTYFS